MRNPPITEAIVNFEVQVPTTLEIEKAFAKVDARVKKDYPDVQQLMSFEGEMDFSPERVDVRQTTASKVVGGIYKTEDDLQVAQFRLNGFTFNRLRPYTDWTEIFPEAMRLWSVYCAAYSPTLISKLSVRFINHIEVPGSIDQLDTFFTAPVNVPQGVSRKISNFLTRVTVVEDELEVFTDITQALGQTSDETRTLTLLDIDSYQSFDGLKPQDEETITLTFAKLRDAKNRAFFGSITERTVELYL